MDEALWDDYGYHHDDLVEAASMVPLHLPWHRQPAESAPAEVPLRPR